MKLKDRAKTYSFWVSLTSAVILIVKLICQNYGFSINETFISDLVTTICGLLVILGIIVIPKNDLNDYNCKNTNNNAETIENEQNPNNDNDNPLNEIQPEIQEGENNAYPEDTHEEFNNINESLEILNESQVNSLVEEISTDNNNDFQIESSNDSYLIKQHIDDVLKKEKELFLNDFSKYKQILLEEINKIDE